VANSYAVERETVASERIDSARITVIYNGVDVQAYHQGFSGPAGGIKATYGVPDDSPVVGAVANYQRKVKGIDYFIGAARLVASQVDNVFFFIVGYGRPQQRAALQHYVHELGLESCLILAGPQEDIRPFLSAFSVGVLPSLSEGFSNSLLEYMAAGLPCVATNVGGNKELVVDGENGFLVKPASAEALAEKIVVLLRNPELREKMGRMAQERVRTDFSMTKMIRELETLYEHLYLCSSRAKAAARRGFGPSGGGWHRRAFPKLTGKTRHGVKTT
jgi:glycosyltransferase involved in cell wall biosynthesis